MGMKNKFDQLNSHLSDLHASVAKDGSKIAGEDSMIQLPNGKPHRDELVQFSDAKDAFLGVAHRESPADKAVSLTDEIDALSKHEKDQVRRDVRRPFWTIRRPCSTLRCWLGLQSSSMNRSEVALCSI